VFEAEVVPRERFQLMNPDAVRLGSNTGAISAMIVGSTAVSSTPTMNEPLVLS
jgi:hypothetical protein